MLTYVGVPKDGNHLAHYGRLGMKWGKHIFGDDPRWGVNGRGKAATTRFGFFSEKKEQAKAETLNRAAESNQSVKEVLAQREKLFDERDAKYPLSRAKKFSKQPSMEQVIKGTNPEYFKEGAAEKGYFNNCVNCSVAFDLRMKGYDVKAAPLKDQLGRSMSEYKRIYKDAIYATKVAADYRYGSLEKFQRDFTMAVMRQCPEGGWGMMHVENTFEHFGHAMNFVADKSGVYIVDPQSNRLRSFYDVANNYNEIYVMRTDNLKVDEHGCGSFLSDDSFDEKDRRGI